MSVPAISSVASDFVESRLLSTTNEGFNQLILETSATYGVPSFQLSTSPVNLYIGRFDIPTLLKSGVIPNFPCAIMSAAKSDTIGRNSLQVTPSTFSGNIIISLDFYIMTQCASLPSNGQAQYQAIEDAVVRMLSTDVSYALMPQGLTFNDESMVEQGRMEFGPIGDTTAWLQHIACTILFRGVV